MKTFQIKKLINRVTKYHNPTMTTSPTTEMK